MADVRQMRKRLTAVLAVLLGLDLICAIILISPLGRSRQEEIQSLQLRLRLKTQQVQPLRGLDQKVLVAKQQIADFYRDRLPGDYSAIAEEMGKVAEQNGTNIAQVKYHLEDEEGGGLRPITIDSLLSGDYLHVVKFINALERDKMLFIVNSIALGDAKSGTVKLQLKMQTYLRSGA
jgi:type IV pilus assembly protein PilO